MTTGLYQDFDLDTLNGDYDFSVEAGTNIVYDRKSTADFYSVPDCIDSVTDIVIDSLSRVTSDPLDEVTLTWSKPTGADYTEYNFLSNSSAPSVENFTTGTEINARDVLGKTTTQSTYTVLTYALSFDKYHFRPSLASNQGITDIKAIKEKWTKGPGRPITGLSETSALSRTLLLIMQIAVSANYKQ